MSGIIQVRVGEKLFEFESMENWISTAQIKFRNAGHTSESVICVDDDATIVTNGKQFEEAKYPVRAYAIADAPFYPSGMRSPRTCSTCGREGKDCKCKKTESSRGAYRAR